MNKETKKAILVVSFGTSHNDTRAKTIDVIEEDIQNAYPDYKVYRAWTSKMIMAKILKRDDVKIMNVAQAMQAMTKDGITEVIVQPTHVINGIENDLMKEDVCKFRESFEVIKFGTPLLSSKADSEYMIRCIAEEFKDLEKDEVLVLMGHGTTHFANASYAALDYEFKDLGYKNIFMGTVEAYPSMESLQRMIQEYGAKKIRLAPFMIVAGEHAKNDLSGDAEDSWYSQFTKAGYQVRCELKGLGEYTKVRELFVKHIAEQEWSNV